MHRHCTHSASRLLFTNSHTHTLCRCQFFSRAALWSVVGLFAGAGRSRESDRWVEEVLLDLTGCGRSSLAAHAGGVDRFRGDQIQVFVVGDLVQPVPVLKELNVQVLVDLLG